MVSTPLEEQVLVFLVHSHSPSRQLHLSSKVCVLHSDWEQVPTVWLVGWRAGRDSTVARSKSREATILIIVESPTGNDSYIHAQCAKSASPNVSIIVLRLCKRNQSNKSTSSEESFFLYDAVSG